MSRGLRPLVGLVGAAALIAALPGAAPAAAAASQLVAVVIDFGPGGPAPLVKCVDIAGQGQVTDLTVVNEALNEAGDEQAGLCSNGLVYSLSGYPASGADICSSPSDPAYWAYFDGTSAGWSYSNDGPAFQLSTPQTTIGWRYEPTGAATPPTGDPDPVAQCPVASSVTPTTLALVAPPVHATTGTTQAGGGANPSSEQTPTTLKAKAKAKAKVKAEAATPKSTTRHRTTAKDAAPAVALQGASSSSSNRGGSGGSAVPTIAALGAFALIAAGTAYVVRRRRAA